VTSENQPWEEERTKTHEKRNHKEEDNAPTMQGDEKEMRREETIF
jgi:hypothetical protein